MREVDSDQIQPSATKQRAPVVNLELAEVPTAGSYLRCCENDPEIREMAVWSLGEIAAV